MFLSKDNNDKHDFDCICGIGSSIIIIRIIIFLYIFIFSGQVDQRENRGEGTVGDCQ